MPSATEPASFVIDRVPAESATSECPEPLGLPAEVTASWARFAAPLVRDFLIVGFCGGYTTVSSFALQTLALGQDGETRAAALNVLGSTAACLAAAAAGVWIAGTLAG